ncbi:MFS transporter [Sulfidibacter corallicola]|uniref:MFS transporter n=1 Tax=Sulfidibacter corallicola TaxID=2818388 RepID=A0A8A4TMA5_SULCO|nr:MFS transporter [Sulfidibacter corallicola]QTD47725.1 MFS transporter [Sulfidibacter corallicola]
MSQPKPSHSLADRSFIAFTLTQYFGAFNDNVFKQLMLLLALTLTQADQQGTAMIVFSAPFLIFSGFAGQLSEKFAKTTVMRGAKVGELVIMIMGCIGFYTANFPFLLFTLFLMGTQSAFFGPAKYGAIPELLETHLLVKANGVVQMTTFLAIILGIALAGFLKDIFADQLYVAGAFCILIALLGIGTVYLILPREANRPKLRISKDPFANITVSLRKIWTDKAMLFTVIAASFFWFSGGVVAQAVNNYGINLKGLDASGTSLLMVALSVGIMVGCLMCSPIQHRMGSKWTVLLGALFVALGEGLLYFHLLPLGAIYGLLFLAGLGSGLYYVPLAAYMQARPPMGEKGEILAAINFCNYIGIVGSGAVWMGLIYLKIPANMGLLLLSFALVLIMVPLYGQLGHLDESGIHED